MKPLVPVPALALLTSAAFWGVVWYPYRLLAAAGLDGLWATVTTYGLALVLGAAVFHRQLAELRGLSLLAVAMSLSIGVSNLGYVLGILQGDVMRVLLLFYLAPLWTVPLAHLILSERLDAKGLAVIAVAFMGAVTMLWRPDLGAPWPSSYAEWLGVVSGAFFALGNVLVRRLEEMGDAAKSIVIWAGVTMCGLVFLPFSANSAAQAFAAARAHWALVAATAASLVAMSYLIQYGLSRLPANRAIVILLFELVVAAIAAHYLAGERLRIQDWVGGSFIVLATLLSSSAKTSVEPDQPGLR